MEVAHARKVLPCLDEPSFKATFQVTLGHESKMKALSNMPDVSSVLMYVNQSFQSCFGLDDGEKRR